MTQHEVAYHIPTVRKQQLQRFYPISVQLAYVWLTLWLIVHDNDTPQCVQTRFTRDDAMCV